VEATPCFRVQGTRPVEPPSCVRRFPQPNVEGRISKKGSVAPAPRDRNIHLCAGRHGRTRGSLGNAARCVCWCVAVDARRASGIPASTKCHGNAKGQCTGFGLWGICHLEKMTARAIRMSRPRISPWVTMTMATTGTRESQANFWGKKKGPVERHRRRPQYLDIHGSQPVVRKTFQPSTPTAAACPMFSGGQPPFADWPLPASGVLLRERGRARPEG